MEYINSNSRLIYPDGSSTNLVIDKPIEHCPSTTTTCTPIVTKEVEPIEIIKSTSDTCKPKYRQMTKKEIDRLNRQIDSSPFLTLVWLVLAIVFFILGIVMVYVLINDYMSPTVRFILILVTIIIFIMFLYSLFKIYQTF